MKGSIAYIRVQDLLDYFRAEDYVHTADYLAGVFKNQETVKWAKLTSALRDYFPKNIEEYHFHNLRQLTFAQ
jgi:hypothetical protein